MFCLFWTLLYTYHFFYFAIVAGSRRLVMCSNYRSISLTLSTKGTCMSKGWGGSTQLKETSARKTKTKTTSHYSVEIFLLSRSGRNILERVTRQKEWNAYFVLQKEKKRVYVSWKALVFQLTRAVCKHKGKRIYGRIDRHWIGRSNLLFFSCFVALFCEVYCTLDRFRFQSNKHEGAGRPLRQYKEKAPNKGVYSFFLRNYQLKRHMRYAHFTFIQDKEKVAPHKK